MSDFFSKNSRSIDGTVSPACNADLAIFNGKIDLIAQNVHARRIAGQIN